MSGRGSRRPAPGQGAGRDSGRGSGVSGAGGRGTNTTPRTTPGSASRSGSRSVSRSAGATTSGARTGVQDPIKARKAPTGDPQRDAALAGISSKLDKLRQHNQQRQPTQPLTAPTTHADNPAPPELRGTSIPRHSQYGEWVVLPWWLCR